jgi:hypothetical protein
MRIVIPTRGRVNRQCTFGFLSPALRARTDIVCPEREVREFYTLRNDYCCVAQPDPDMTIAQKRAWIMRTWSERYERIVMLDDDLEWFVRKAPGDWHLRYVTNEDMDRWFGELEAKLSPALPHAGFGPRQNNNQQEPVWRTPDRMMYTLGYHLPTVLSVCELGRIEHREDMDYCLQLLRAGLPNAVNHELTASQGGYGKGGGGTEGERTVEASNADAERLAELHPGYVRVSKRGYTSSVPRLEVVCQWKKALEDGLRGRGVKL